MSDDVARVLERSARLEADLTPLFERPRRPESQRGLLTMALCDVAMEFWASQRVLIETPMCWTCSRACVSACSRWRAT